MSSFLFLVSLHCFTDFAGVSSITTDMGNVEGKDNVQLDNKALEALCIKSNVFSNPALFWTESPLYI